MTTKHEVRYCSNCANALEWVEQEEDGGRVDDELVLQHVRAEQVALTRLVEGRADREVEDDQRRAEPHGGPARVRRRRNLRPET